MRLGDRAEGKHVAATRIREKNIDRGMLLLAGVVKPVDVGEVGHVGAHAGDPAADLLHRTVQHVLAPPGDEHRSAFRDKGFGGGNADAAGPAGHDDHLVLEPIRHCSSPALRGGAPLPLEDAAAVVLLVVGDFGT